MAESPAKVHGAFSSDMLAVNGAGEVFVYDEVSLGESYRRLMVFRPHEGDHADYEYVGEVAAGPQGSTEPRAPVFDEAGNLYVAGIDEGGNHVEELAHETPGAYPNASLAAQCTYTKSGLIAMTVDPKTGKPFVYSWKPQTEAHWMRYLGSCEEGKFKEVGKVQLSPERGDIYALAFDPEARAEPSRPAGTLYAGVPVPYFEEGTSEASQSSLGYIYGQPKGPAKTLTVSRGGGGAGSVSSEPIGIECGSLCSQEFEEGETLTLTATPDEGSTFSGWAGECASTSGNECEVTMSAARSVEASFEEEGGGPTEYPLTTHVTGEGTIECAPPGGDCGAGHEYLAGTTVTLTAVADEGWEFLEWTGACAGTLLPACEVTIEEATEVGAVFESEPGTPTPPLTINIEEGSGTVVSNPAGIECTGSEGESCSTEEIEEGTVTLTASAAPGYVFKSWKGCDKKSGEFGVNGRQCVIELSEAREVGAKFVKTWSLTLSGTGPGKVSSKPGGALCLPNCSETTAAFKEGTSVEVLAKPNKHFHLAAWGGDCSGTGSCVVAMGEDHQVSASFAEDPKLDLTIAKQGGGQALVKTKGPGSVCGFTCSQSSASFYEGEVVEVLWKLNKGTASIDWGAGSGTCTGTETEAEGTCMVTMSAARSLSAELE